MKKCPFFFRLEDIWGTRPNVRPPIAFSSGANTHDTANNAQSLLDLLNDSDTPEDIEHTPHIQNTNLDTVLDEDCNTEAEIQKQVTVDRWRTNYQVRQQAADTENNISTGSSPDFEKLNSEEDEEEEAPRSHRTRFHKILNSTTITEEDISDTDEPIPLFSQRTIKPTAYNQSTPKPKLKTTAKVSSAIKSTKKRQFPQPINLDSDDDNSNTPIGSNKNTKYKRSRNGTGGGLSDAITILAESRERTEDKRFNLLRDQLKSQRIWR